MHKYKKIIDYLCSMVEKYDKIRQFVTEEMKHDNSGHGLMHALRVTDNACRIAEAEGGNLHIIITAALMHDCADHKLFADINAQINKIKTLLENCGYQQTDIAHILYIIQNISYNKGKNAELSTLEAMIVRDADRLDALGAIGIIRTIEYGSSKGRPFYSCTDLWDENTTLNHFYDKLFKLKGLIHTETARKMADERDKFMHSFIEQFYREIGVSNIIQPD